MQSNNSITSTISYVKTFALLMFIYMLGGGFISISLAAKIQSISLAVLGFIVFIIVPLILIKTLQKRFLKKIVFVFENESVLVQIFNLKTESLEREYRYNYNDIKSCILSSTSNRTSTIKLYFSKAAKFQCTFINEKGDTENNYSLSVFRELHLSNANIELSPPFYASKGGIAALIILTLLLITDIIISLLYKPGSLPFSLFVGVALYIQIIVRRSRDIETFKQLSK